MNNRIVGIMTVYYPTQDNVQNAKQILQQVDLLLICDNSPTKNNDLFIDLPNIKYYYFGKNLGLSSAFNIALKDENNKWDDNDFVIFFDQDTQIASHHIEKLKKEYLSLAHDKQPIGAIGPVYYNMNTQEKNIASLKSVEDVDTVRVTSIITTSMLTQYKILKKINFWNENIFLDWADFDICWRLTEAGFSVYKSNVSIVKHTLGEGAKRVGRFIITVDKPFREYYQIRDALSLVFREYTPLKMKIRFLSMLVTRPIVHGLLLDQRKEREYYIVRGIKDFFRRYHASL